MRIFISKNVDDCEPLVQFCKINNIALTAQSLIEFEAIPFKIDSHYDVVFFSSIRSAQFYFEKEIHKETVIFACTGETTNAKLKQLGVECSFIGEEAGNPKKTAEKFKNWVKNRIVFFPQSNLSLGTFSSVLPSKQVLKQIIYETILIKCKIVKCQIYIFTSPSNLDAFLTINELSEDSKIILWGKSTLEYAKTKSVKSTFILTKSNFDELVQLLQRINS